MPHAPGSLPDDQEAWAFSGLPGLDNHSALLSALSTQDADSAANADVAGYGMDHADRRSAHRRCRRIGSFEAFASLARSEPTETASLVTLLPASPEPMP